MNKSSQILDYTTQYYERENHRKQPLVSPPIERSCFYDKSQNELFKKRFSFDLSEKQK